MTDKRVHYTAASFDSFADHGLVHATFDDDLLKDRKRLNRLFDELQTRIFGPPENVIPFDRTED